MRRTFTDIELYDVDLYANDTVTIVRPVADEEEQIYMILGVKGVNSPNPTEWVCEVY
jgi:hypothetical protein